MSTESDLVSSALLESKRLCLRNRWEDAAGILEKALKETEKPSECSKIAKKLTDICIQLSGRSDSQLPKCLKSAESGLLKALSARKAAGLEDEGLVRLMLVTYNNWATFHKTKRSYHMSLNYLMKALRLLDDLPVSPSPDTLQYTAKTLLNTSALYADLHRYSEAISYSEQCLATLQKELNLRLNGRLLEHLSAKEREKFETMITTYVVAFYNIGVSEEALGQAENALKAYKNAVKIGGKFLPSGSPELVLAKKALKMQPESGRPPQDTHPISSDEYRSLLLTQLNDLGPLSTREAPTASEIPFNSTSSNEPFKYYSPTRLQELHERLKKGEKVEFVSADDYFMKKITSNLKVEKDVRHMRPLSA